MADHYEDNYFAEDAIYMERNSRDFRRRVATINDNAYALTEYLRSRSLVDETATDADRSGRVIKEVYYPRYSSPENYAAMQRFPTTGKGGFGGLFSLFFTSDAASTAFYDNLHCAKGPSLGTVFTLASPYAILAHYYELEWAQGYGVEANLVRVSVGLEDYEYLEEIFRAAVDAGEAAERESARRRAEL
jgi:cystathionine gamma-synthase